MKSLSSEIPTPTASSSIPVTVEWIEDVVGFTQNDFLVSGGRVAPGSFRELSQSKYTLNIVPLSSNAELRVAVVEGGVLDKAGNKNVQSEELAIVHG